MHVVSGIPNGAVVHILVQKEGYPRFKSPVFSGALIVQSALSDYPLRLVVQPDGVIGAADSGLVKKLWDVAEPKPENAPRDVANGGLVTLDILSPDDWYYPESPKVLNRKDGEVNDPWIEVAYAPHMAGLDEWNVYERRQIASEGPPALCLGHTGPPEGPPHLWNECPSPPVPGSEYCAVHAPVMTRAVLIPKRRGRKPGSKNKPREVHASAH